MKKCNLWQKLVSQVIFQIFIKNLVLDMLHSNSILVLYLVYFFLKIHLYFIILSLAKRSHKWVKNDCISNEKARKCFILLSYLCSVYLVTHTSVISIIAKHIIQNSNSTKNITLD